MSGSSLALARLPRAHAVAREGMAAGLHAGVQVCVWLGEKSVVDDAIGRARPGAAATPETINAWLSATKPLVAVAVARLLEAGLIDLDAPVWEYVPEFAAGGKDAVTLRHILTHTACLSPVAEPAAADFDDANAHWQAAVARALGVPLLPECVPGERAAYDPAGGWYVLAEVVERLDGRRIDRFLAEELFTPLEMASWSLTVDAARRASLADRLGWMYRRSPGQELSPDPRLNSAAEMEVLRPGSSGRGTARHLAHFYRMLLQGGQWHGRRILRPETVALFTSRQRRGMFDHTFRAPLDWGLGFMVNSRPPGSDRPVPYGFGRHAGPDAFGHGGRESSVAFADPRHELVVAVHFNGMPGEGRHQQRIDAFLTAVYEDLGLDAARGERRRW